jgi:hypothetical protein
MINGSLYDIYNVHHFNVNIINDLSILHIL